MPCENKHTFDDECARRFREMMLILGLAATDLLCVLLLLYAVTDVVVGLCRWFGERLVRLVGLK